MIFKVFDKSCVPPFGRGPGSVLPRHVVKAARRKTIKPCVTGVRVVTVVRAVTLLRAVTVLRAVTAVRGLRSVREVRVELLWTPKPVGGQTLFGN